MKKLSIIVLLTISLFCFCSCATIISGSKANITLKGNSEDFVTIKTDVEEYSNIKLPAMVKIKRGSSISRVEIQGNNYDYQDLLIYKKINGKTWWNLLVGGLIGFGIDACSGAIYKPSQTVYNVEGIAKNFDAKNQGSVSNSNTEEPVKTTYNNHVEVPTTVETKQEFTGLSDVDINIPKSKVSNDKTFVIIIANEKYQDEADVSFAARDGQMFETYCKQVLGIPSMNIHYRENATRNHIITELDWLKKVCDVFDGDSKVIFYYSGHGVPDESNRHAYLLPIDGIGNNVMTGYKLSELYGNLSKLKTERVIVFLDACFSGSQRNGKALVSARGVAIASKQETPTGRMIALTAAQGDETAYPYQEKGHGLFTYFLLKKLQESKGDCTIEELGEYIKTQVSRRAIVVNGKNQTPVVISSVSLGDAWKSMKLR